MPRQLRNAKPVIYVFCEGESEQAYHERNQFCHIKGSKYCLLSGSGAMSCLKRKHQPIGTNESPEQTTPYITKWDDNLIRKFVKTVTVVSASKIIVTLYHGTEIEQEVEK